MGILLFLARNPVLSCKKMRIKKSHRQERKLWTGESKRGQILKIQQIDMKVRNFWYFPPTYWVDFAVLTEQTLKIALHAPQERDSTEIICTSQVKA